MRNLSWEGEQGKLFPWRTSKLRPEAPERVSLALLHEVLNRSTHPWQILSPWWSGRARNSLFAGRNAVRGADLHLQPKFRYFSSVKLDTFIPNSLLASFDSVSPLAALFLEYVWWLDFYEPIRVRLLCVAMSRLICPGPSELGVLSPK